MHTVRVAVVDEREIFRLGVVSCLQDGSGLTVVSEGPQGPVEGEPDVAIVSQAVVQRTTIPCPVLVVVSHPSVRDVASKGNRVMGLLPIVTLTPERLIGAATAAAAGMEVVVADDTVHLDLDPRSLQVLHLLADGADTQDIAAELGCSARTVKAAVQQLKRALDARSRAEAVAKAICAGLI